MKSLPMTVAESRTLSFDLERSEKRSDVNWARIGDRKHVKIIRETEGKPEIMEFDIRPNSVIKSKYYYIYPNDIIYVQKDPASFYKANSYGSFIGLISSSISLFTTVFYFTELNKK